MEKEYTYAVARIRALECSLFTDDIIGQLLACHDYDSCMDFLRSHGWGDGNISQSMEDMMKCEKEKTKKVLSELVEDDDCRILNIPDEYHNLKAAIKSVCTQNTDRNVFIKGCANSPEFLMECVKQGNFDRLPSDMAAPAKEATEALLKSGNGQLCDIIIDKAALEAMKKAGEDSENEMIKQYALSQAAIADIKVAVRCAAAGRDANFVKKALVECSDISVKDLCAAVESGIEGVYSYLENTGYKEAVDALKTSMSAFERWCDDYVMDTIRPQKYNSFTVGPIAAYALARDNEIKTVKIILSGKLNGLDDEFIKERVRAMYA